ncbi:MAG: hypothetical protein ACYC3L_13995 [Gemmatimonadaceae bacterium]
MRPLALALVVVASTAGAQLPRAYSYEFRLDPGGKKEKDVIRGTVRVAGARARVDTDERDKDHDYLLVGDGGRTVYVVHDDQRTYEEHDADDFARIVGTAMRAAGPVFKLTVSDARIDTARLGSGGTVAGRPTQHVRLNQRWRTSMRVMGFVKEDLRGSATGEYWADPSLALMRNPLFDIVSTSLFALAASDEEFLARADASRARLFRGSPLKADITFSMGGSDGDDESRLRYEVTKLTPGAVDERALEIPKGYRRTSEKTFRM